MADKPVRAKLSLRKKLAFTALLVVSPLLLLESLLRFLDPLPSPGPPMPAKATTGPQQLNPLEYFAICDAHLGIRNRADGSYRAWFIEGEPLCTTDRFGYRNGLGWPGEDDAPIVLFVGDSVTFCAEVDDQHTGPSEVARLLGGEFDVRVLNTGVRSYGTVQAKRMLLECLDRFPQVEVAVYTFCGNDLEENIVPYFRFPFNAPYLVYDETAGKYREVEVGDPVVPPGEEFYGWEAPPPVLGTGAKVAHWLGARSALLRRCLAGLRRVDLGTLDSDAFPDGKRAVPYADYAKWHNWAAANGGNVALQQLLAEMDQICREHGVAFVTTCSFNGSDRGSCNAFAANCAEAGVRYVNLEEEFTDSPAVYICRRTDGVFDQHYGRQGTKAYARALAPALKQILRSGVSAPPPDAKAAGPPGRPEPAS